MDKIDKLEIILQEYSQIAIIKAKEVEILIKASKVFENIPKQYHDQCIVGMIVFAIILIPLILSLLFKKKGKTSPPLTPSKKQLVKYSTPNKQTPNKKTPIKSPNANNKQQTPNKQTPTKSPKSLVKYEYPENDDDFEEQKPVLAIEGSIKGNRKTKTPKKKLEMCLSPPVDRKRVPVSRFNVADLSNPKKKSNN